MIVRHPDPPLSALQLNYVAAVEPWGRDGFPVLIEQDFQQRFAICPGCVWYSDGREGLGHCEHPEQSCRKIKHWLAGNRCPIGLWPELLRFQNFPHRP